MIEKFQFLNRAYDLAAGFTPSPGSEILKDNSALFACLTFDLQKLLTEVEELLDRCGNDLFQDVESPCGG